jgi:hypothetical protein
MKLFKSIFCFLKSQVFLLVALLVSCLICWKIFYHGSDSSAVQALPLPKPVFDAVKNDREHLRQHVMDSLGYGEDLSIEARVAVTKNLPDDLSKVELEKLLSSLLEARPSNLSDGAYAHYFHELCNKLHQFPDARTQFASVLYALASDPKRDDVIRDYSQQHLRRIWEKSPELAELRLTIEASFWKLTEQQPSVASSALLSLHTLGAPPSPHPDFSQSAVASLVFQPRVESILQQSPSSDAMALRMTAVRIAGERNLTALTPTLTQMIQNESEHTLVRISAINALRLLGKSEEIKSLAIKLQQNVNLTTAFQYATR